MVGYLSIKQKCPFSNSLCHFSLHFSFSFALTSVAGMEMDRTGPDQTRLDQSPGFICHLQTLQCTHCDATMRKLEVWQAKQWQQRQPAQREIEKRAKKVAKGHLSFDYRSSSSSLLFTVQTFSLMHFSISPPSRRESGVDTRLAARLAAVAASAATACAACLHFHFQLTQLTKKTKDLGNKLAAGCSRLF